MTTRKENLLDWLRDAHAMEQQAEKMLSAQSERIEHYPELKARMEQHLRETQGQKARLEKRITELGSSPSTFKDIGGKLMAFGQAVGGMTLSDEVVKGAMSGYVFENLEIATYTVLLAAARQVGDSQTVLLAEQNLKEEQAMAGWLLEHLPQVTAAFLERSEAPDTEAKR